LEMLRSYTGQEVPFVACTATASTSTLDTIWNSLTEWLYSHERESHTWEGFDQILSIRPPMYYCEAVLNIPGCLNDSENLWLVAGFW
jgi:hypothetical protein